jgi:hypothetical protein
MQIKDILLLVLEHLTQILYFIFVSYHPLVNHIYRLLSRQLLKFTLEPLPINQQVRSFVT